MKAENKMNMKEFEIKSKTFILLAIFLVLTLSSLAFISSAYARTNPAYTQTTFQPHTGSVDFPFLFNREMCQAGQDFILQIDPRGCSPSVIRSDLLEDQNVPVFCPIVGTKLNPMIDVEAINNIRFTFNGTAPREVQGLSYVPARAALVAPKLQTNQPVLNNLGYVVIVLKRQPNESAMPDFVQGSLTATLRYDIKNAFGVGQAVYYLPELSDDDWEENIVQYGFWHGKGYLRAESIDDNSATISVYSDRESYGLGRVGEKRKIASHTIEVGKTSPLIPMPGFNYCLGSMDIKLNGLENPDTRAKLRVNEDVFEVKDIEKFLENKCSIRKIEKYGIVERVEVRCQEDERTSNFALTISPNVTIEIDGIKEYSIGDFLYKNGTKDVFLGFIGTKKGLTSQESLYVRLVLVSSEGRVGNKLTQSEIASIASYDKGGISKVIAYIGDKAKGWSFEEISYGQPKQVFGKNIQLNGFAGAVDVDFPATTEGTGAKNNYEKAMKDYEEIRKDFSSDLYPKTGSDERTLGEKSLFGEIELAWKTNHKKTASDLCKEFLVAYPDSAIGAPADCENTIKLSSPHSDVQEVLINGRTYLISFDGVKEPSPEEYGVDIFVNGAQGDFNGDKLNLGKNEKISLSDKEYISLVDLDTDYAVFDIRGLERSRTSSLTNTIKIKLNSVEVVGSNNYRISVTKINLKKVAKVSISPNIHLTETRANFQFKIGIEKRGIQLSPEKTKEKIESLNKTLEKWRGINTKLGTVVEAGKTACLLTGTALTAKNFLANLAGKGIARQKVMRGTDGWFEKCSNAVNQKTLINGKQYDNVDSCLLGNSAEINQAVDTVSEAMKTQNEQLENLQDQYKKSNSFLGEDVVDTDGLMKDYVDDSYRQEIQTNLQNAGITNVKVGNGNVSVADVVKLIAPGTVFLTQARNLQLNSRLLSSQDENVKKIALAEVNKGIADIYINSEREVAQKSFVDKLPEGLKNIGVEVYAKQGSINAVYEGKTSTQQVVSIPANVPVQGIIYNNVEYIVQLENVRGENYRVVEIYNIAGIKMSSELPDYSEIKSKFIFKKYDSTTYQNAYPAGIARVKYFERDPYKGLPAVVPFDLKNGWYAAVKSVIPIGGNIRAYDDSGRVSSFWLCNIGSNKREEGIGVGDDICQMINLGTGQPYNQFPGLETSEASRVVATAIKAIEQASVARARDAKVSQVSINGQTIKVGEPAVELPDIQCQDFMSPTDCNILFNMCDPVICPSSRCDFGGTYPVQDVVQSGVVGGLLLCAPNFPEVKVPICLSAVHAGIESYLSVLDSYQQCLKTSLETGQTVGICDEIQSVYMCEFFWRQGLPLANIVAPKIISSVVGQNVRGGGEYLGVQDAWQRAGDSIDYMTQYYADDSYKAFKARSSESTGAAVCKNWLSLTAPGGGNILDAITKPDVPAQFYGRFDEIPFTTVTNPPVSQYKVFYHVFAGKDFPAYYQVYLRGTAGTFFHDTDIRRVIATGFIPVGQYETQTIDITAPSGYKEMCIVVNNQEECGFKQVTTDFGINYVTEQFVADQASEKDITSEAACISGTPSLAGLLTPNAQSAAESVVNPALYNRGITRICATDNPGKATDQNIGIDKARWITVGYCGNTNIKCWLDRQSVENTIKSTTTEDKVLDSVTAKEYVDALGQSTPLDEAQFEAIVKEIENVKDTDTEKIANKKIDLINQNINKILFNHQKGYLTLLRADAYSAIARSIFDKLKVEEETKKIVESGETTPENITAQPAGEQIQNQTQEELVETITEIEKEKNQEVNNMGKNYPVFTFKDGNLFRENLHYSFSGNNWYFSGDKERWVPVEYASIENKQVENVFPKGADLVEDIAIANDQSDKNKEFMKSLIGKSYATGLSLLIQRLVKNDEGALSIDTELSTENVDFSSNGVFEVSRKITLKSPERTYEIVYFDFTDGKWRWSIGEKYWVPASEYSIRKESVFGDDGLLTISDSNFINFLKILNGKNSLEGAAFIFAMDTESGIVPTAIELTCDSNTECQKALGNEIIGLAKEIKQQGVISDSTVKQDTGAESFECLVLMVAYRESFIQQCESFQINQNPLYCDGNEFTVLGGDSGASLGVMQINTVQHKSVNAADFEENIKYGANLLLQNYNSFGKESKVYTCNSKTYTGWQAALRYYNGWNTDCTKGNIRYVEDVLGFNDEVKALFPEVCAVNFSRV